MITHATSRASTLFAALARSRGGGGGGAGGRDAAHGLFQSLRETRRPFAMDRPPCADVLELAGLGAHRAMGLHDLLAHATHRVLKGVHASSDDLQDAIRLVHAAELGEKVVVVRRAPPSSRSAARRCEGACALVAAWTVTLASISLAYAVTSKSSLRKGARRGSPCDGRDGTFTLVRVRERAREGRCVQSLVSTRARGVRRGGERGARNVPSGTHPHREKGVRPRRRILRRRRHPRGARSDLPRPMALALPNPTSRFHSASANHDDVAPAEAPFTKIYSRIAPIRSVSALHVAASSVAPREFPRARLRVSFRLATERRFLEASLESADSTVLPSSRVLEASRNPVLARRPAVGASPPRPPWGTGR